MKALILYFLLLVLEILLNLGPDIGHKHDGFSKTLLEKGLEFNPSKRSNIIALNLSLVLLPVEVDLVPKEQGRKKNTLGTCSTGRVEMVFTLSTKVVALHLRTTIV